MGLAVGLAFVVVGALISHVGASHAAGFTTGKSKYAQPLEPKLEQAASEVYITHQPGETYVVCPNCGHDLSIQITKSAHMTERHRDG